MFEMILLADDGSSVLGNSKKYYIQQNMMSSISSHVDHSDSLGYFIEEHFIMSSIKNKNITGIDSEVGVVLNHAFAASLGCYFMQTNSVTISSPDGVNKVYQDFKYCTNRIAYIPMSYGIIHPKITLAYGIASLNLKQKFSSSYMLIHPSPTLSDPNSQTTNGLIYFQIFKPMVSVEANLMSFIRTSFGIGYSWLWPFDWYAVNKQAATAIEGWEFQFTVSLGVF